MPHVFVNVKTWAQVHILIRWCVGDVQPRMCTSVAWKACRICSASTHMVLTPTVPDSTSPRTSSTRSSCIS